MTKAFLSIRNFRKTYGEVVAVENVSLEVPRGEFLTFLGPSGSGKSTTLYAIAGFDDPTAGDILLEGKSILKTPSHLRNIGMVFQRYTLFPHLTVAENVAFPLRVRKQDPARVESRVKEMLSLVRLERFGERMPAQLSGGQQQRVALARALAYDPPVLLMDEPLSALDKKLRDEIQIEIRRIHRETGVTVLYVTHDQEEALRLSDRIAVFSHGRIEQVGTGIELYRNPATRFVAGFVGDSNFLSVAEVKKAVKGKVEAILPDGTRVTGCRLHGEARDKKKFELMLRPQALRVVPKAKAAMLAKVLDVTFLGENATALLLSDWGQQFWMRSPAQTLASLTADERVGLAWNEGEAQIF